MKLFRDDNTEGYTQDQLNELNNEWEQRAQDEGLSEGTYGYDQAAKQFCDEVARR